MPHTRNIYIVAKNTLEAETAWKKLARKLLQLGLTPFVDHKAPGLAGDENLFDIEHLSGDPELLVVVGGDGTFLGTARSAVPRGVPLLGINLGTLGFLTEFDFSHIESVARMIYERDLAFQEREALLISSEIFDEPVVAINDAVVNKNALSRMIDLEVLFHSGDSYAIRADGLIVSTPTGSTAYNLSAGGPIVSPDLHLLVLNPICPHGLGYRPLVVPSADPITLRLLDGESMFLTVDGQVGGSVQPGQEVSITRHPKRLRVAVSPHNDFLDVLRRKMGWGKPAYRSADTQNQP